MTVVIETDGLNQSSTRPARSRRLWVAASAAWTGLILFSSTSLAAEYCERAFTWFYASIFGRQHGADHGFDALHFIAEKGLHLTLFFVLGILLWRVFAAPRLRRLGEVVLMGLIVGTASELLQTFFPGRDPAIRDVFINLAGAFLGASACFLRS